MQVIRAVNSLIVELLLIVVGVSCIAVASSLVSNYIRTNKPAGEVLDYFVVAEQHYGTEVVAVKVSLYVSCSGERCNQYSISNLIVRGYVRNSGAGTTLYTSTSSYPIKNGLTKIDVVGYLPKTTILDELVVSFSLTVGGEVKNVTKSVSLR